MNHVTHEHWFVRLMAAPIVILLFSLIWYPGVVINYWNTRGWPARILLVSMLPLLLVGVIEVFFHRIVFDNQVIRERSLFRFGEIQRHYSDLVQVILKKNENLTLEFSDGLKMKIWWLNADLADLVQLLREKSGENVHFEAK